ncbi:MAG: response regulator [Proteobacteria bacterium]|nr:response regulator [Pseudomonadota bacterium]
MPTVLIVDDDRFTRKVLETAFAEDEEFARLQVETFTANDGAQGLTEFLKHQPDVVITDLLMPNVDGWELCRAIRSEPKGKYVHLIAMSGITRDASVAQKLQDEVGAQFFTKPYQLRDMTEHLAQVLETVGRGEISHPVIQPRSPLATRPSSGDLSERALPAVLFDFLEAKATGHLTLKRGRITKVIELVVGHPFSVSSTARDETLGYFLVTLGVISPEQHKRAVKRAALKREKVSTTLISLGYISPEDMVSRLTVHTCHRLTQSLRWPDGTWQFQPKDAPPGGPRGNPIDMVALVLEGMRYTASLDVVPEPVAALENQPLVLNARGQTLMPAVRQYLSESLAEVLRHGATVQGLLASGVEPSELYVALEALLYCDAIATGDGVPELIYDSAADDSVAAMSGSSVQDTGEFTIVQLSEHAHTRRITRPKETSNRLYSLLFDDISPMIHTTVGEMPIELPDEEIERFDSGVIDVSGIQEHLQAAADEGDLKYARRLLLKEYLRVQGTDHYNVLNVTHGASHKELSKGLNERKSKLSLEWFSRFDLGRDYAKLEELHAAYDRAFQVLSDDDKRAAYDRSLGGEEAGPPGMAAEMSFYAGWDLLQHGSYEGAVEQLKSAAEAAPDEADYHAALGWANYLRGGSTPLAADEARPHLNQGLLINPDHAASHFYKGTISADLGNDDAEAIFHLERALDADTYRAQALDRLEGLWRRRGEYRPLERQYRRLIYRAAGSNAELELTLWLKLAELYRADLNEPENARVALQSAQQLAPDDPRVQTGLPRRATTDVDGFVDRARRLRQRWRREPNLPDAGLELMHAALTSDQPDAAFMAASALVARGLADREAEDLYQRHRPRFVIRAHRPLGPEHWAQLRHALDSSELCALFEVLTPAIEASFALTLDDLEVDESMRISEEDLPESFVRVRSYVAQILGVECPQVFVRSDFGHQVHVGAISPPLLLAGDEVLTSPERAELSFRLGRAMTYLLPGRTFAGSRPARLLKAAVLAIFRSLHPGAPVDDPDGYINSVEPHLRALDSAALSRAQTLVEQLTQRSHALNLSQWARALGRTADRAGLLLCGDLPAAVRFARDSSNTEAIDDLIDFAVGSNCWQLRDELGLSIAV